ncbi:MAG: ribosomal RNA small subunit methyltransferase A [Kiritimatiellaeota bacterium]|nr:ribosomal RNA small subunit methyltransferase A [Kiritimatiellota bacterium]
MKKSELLEVLNSIGVSPSKRFGQNFMIDGNLLAFIANEAGIHPGDNVLEVGPGCGALTRLMLDKGAELAAIEIDKRLCDYLRTLFADERRFRLIPGDACRIDLAETVATVFAASEEESGRDPADVEWKCVANLPYSISSPFTAKLAELPNPPVKALFLLQKETADRFAASPGTKNYGSLSVVIQLVYKVKYLRTIPPEVFFPAPDVKSALVEFQRLPDPIPPGMRVKVSKIVRSAFSRRRKKMIKALSSIFGKEQCVEVFGQLGISENARAEELIPEKFIELAEALAPAVSRLIGEPVRRRRGEVDTET